MANNVNMIAVCTVTKDVSSLHMEIARLWGLMQEGGVGASVASNAMGRHDYTVGGPSQTLPLPAQPPILYVIVVSPPFSILRVARMRVLIPISRIQHRYSRVIVPSTAGRGIPSYQGGGNAGRHHTSPHKVETGEEEIVEGGGRWLEMRRTGLCMDQPQPNREDNKDMEERLPSMVNGKEEGTVPHTLKPIKRAALTNFQ